MKTLFKNICIASLVFFATGCEDDFLTQSNPNTITTDLFWKTEDDFQKGLTTVYGAMQYTNVGGGNMSSYENIRSDVGQGKFFYGESYAFSLLDWNVSSPYVSNRWQELYVGVFRSNQVIENTLDFAANEDFTEEEKTLILAQARFLRGAFYFWIVNTYGQAVVHTGVPVSEADFNKEISSRDEVVTEVIIPDLEFAYENLPRSWAGAENLGRVTWGAAASMLGKVHLYAEDWGLAADYFREVIDSDIYALTTDIGENFTTWGEFNSESIFEISFNETLNPGISAFAKEDVGSSQGAESTMKARWAAPQLRGGYRVVMPAHWVHELYENDEVDPANPINSDNAYSLRAYWSISFLRQDDGPLGGHYYLQYGPLRDVADWFNGGSESAYWKKGTNWYHVTAENPLSRSGINERLIRLADVYLMYAEAILMRDGEGAVEEALSYIDLVRTRAGVVTLDAYRNGNSGRIPQLHKRGTGASKHPYISLSAQSLMTHLQYVERPLELSFEGMATRWNDLVRWGIVREAFENQEDHVYTELIENPSTGLMEPVDNGILEFCGETCFEPDPFFLGRSIERGSDG